MVTDHLKPLEELVHQEGQDGTDMNDAPAVYAMQASALLGSTHLLYLYLFIMMLTD